MEENINANDLKFARARLSFEHFLDYVYIKDPPPKGRGIIKFEKWPHTVAVAQALTTYRLIVWLKARQIGASWELAAYDLWMALYHPTSVVLLFSQGEDEAQDKLSKCSFIYSKLPPELQTPIGKDNSSEITFPSMYSEIHALPSTPKAGRSYTGTLVDMDEFDFHEYGATNYSAVSATVGDSGGQILLTSTSNPYVQDTEFKNKYRGAPENNFHQIFYPWDVRPGRDEDWYYARSLEYEDPFQFQKEYPNSEQQALGAPDELTAFSVEILEEMERDCRDPIESYADTHIYNHFQPGRRYAVGTDTADGVGLDSSVTVVLDLNTGQVVADVYSSHLPPEELAHQSVKLLALYGNPIWGIENNNQGRLTVKKADELGYPNLYYCGKNKPGFHTNRATKPILWGELRLMVASRSLIVPSATGLKEFYNVQRDPKDGQIIGGVGRSHDDYPMAIALAEQMRAHAHASRITQLMDAVPKGGTSRW